MADKEALNGDCVDLPRKSSSLLGGHRLGKLGAASLLATYCASSSTVLYPTAFGRLGYAATPIGLGLWMLIAMFVQIKLLEVAAPRMDVRSVKDVGEVLGGRVGRTIMSQGVLWNQQLFLPCVACYAAHALKNLVQGPDGTLIDCNVIWILMIVAVFVIGTNALRDFGHTAWIAQVSCVTNAIQVACIVIGVCRVAHGRFESYAGPPALTTEENVRGSWSSVFGAITDFGYGYCPCFVATEVMQEMGERKEIRGALIGATTYMYLLYLVVGIIPAVVVGWELPDPVTDLMAHDPFGIFANAALFFACCLDYMIAAITVNKWLQEKLMPDFDVTDWTLPAVAKWFMLTLPSLTLALAMLLFVPHLETLVCILVAVVVPICQVGAPAALLLVGESKGIVGRTYSIPERVGLVLGILYGIVLLCTGVASTINSFLNLNFHGNYFCEVVGT